MAGPRHDHQTPSLRLGREVDAASELWDLKENPLELDLFNMFHLVLRNVGLDHLAGDEFDALERSLSDALTNPRLGYLVSVSVYTTESGGVVLPSGQLLVPRGVGVDPLDALAASYIDGGLVGTEPPSIQAHDSSFYLWFTAGDKGLIAQTIPTLFVDQLREDAKREKDRREQLADWKRDLRGDPYESIQRAEYWTTVAGEMAKAIRTDAERAAIAALTTRMTSLQAEANTLFQQYQDIQASMARAAKAASVLKTASMIAGLLQHAIEVGDMVCGPNQTTVEGAKEPVSTPLPTMITATYDEIRRYGDQQGEIRMHLEVRIADMQHVDEQLGKAFSDAKIPIPPREFVPPKLK